MRARAGIASLVIGLLALTSCGGGSSQPGSAASSIPGSDRFPVPAVNTVDPEHPGGCTTWPLVSMREVSVPDSSDHAVAYTYADPSFPGEKAVQHRPLPGHTVDPLSMTSRQLRFFGLDPRPTAGVDRHLWHLRYAAGAHFDALGLCTHGSGIGSGPPQHPIYVCGSRLQYTPTLNGGTVTLVRAGDHRPLRLRAEPYVWVSVLTTYSCAKGPRVSISPNRCFTVANRVRAGDGRPVGLLLHGRCSFSLRLNGRPALDVVVRGPRGHVLTRPYHF